MRPGAIRPGIMEGMNEVDVLIVGGGLVGTSLAIALSRSSAGGSNARGSNAQGAKLRVALVEGTALQVDAGKAVPPSHDERNLALARASVNALTAIGVWPHVEARATRIRGVRVSRRGEFGVARFDAAAHGVDAFGATLPASELGRGLLLRLAACTDLQRHAPATLASLDVQTDAVVARLTTPAGEQLLRARLVVGADGTHSFVRRAAGIDAEEIDYAQTAFVCTAAPQRAIDGIAYERFTATGPVAVLPLADRRCGIVLTVPSADAARVAALADDDFVELLHERFGYRLGRFSRLGRRVSYPLRRVMARRLVAPRTVVVGNAAQTLHPIAAQGFNLGLRDALTLAEMLIGERGDGDPGDAGLLARYAERRREDREGTAALSDGLVRWTGSEALPLRILRSLGLVALDRVAPLQEMFVRRGMGFRGSVPRLALGGSGSNCDDEDFAGNDAVRGGMRGSRGSTGSRK